MSHIDIIESLVDDLVKLVVNPAIQSDYARPSALRGSLIENLWNNKFPRTNQFDVEIQLNGLDEKFRIYDRDDLADALRDRRSRLASFNLNWTPEILKLLLELSDRPVINSKLENLDLLKESFPDADPPLRWSVIALEDSSLQEKRIWENVNFADESSEDEYDFTQSKLEVEENECSSNSSIEVEIQTYPENNALEVAKEGLKKLRDSQFWQKVPNVHGIKIETVKKRITELQVVREVLFMFGGYPTSLFNMNSQSSEMIEPSKDHALKDVSHFTFNSLLESFAIQGSAIMSLRNWSKRPQIIPLLQVFQYAILERLNSFDTELSKIHQKFITPVDDVIVSILNTQQEITIISYPLVYLADITKKVDKEPYGHAFRYLEMLFDLTCTSQMAGDDKLYAYIRNFFFECFYVYLRPIKRWIEEGELRKDDKTFFVCEISGNIELPLLWDFRFKIRKTENGALHVPRFLRPAANKIFNTGKSIMLLKHLNQFESLQSNKRSSEPILDFETVCNPDIFQLAPFSEIFDIAFHDWVRSKHQHAASLLRETLFNSCGLHTSLDALSHIYFLSNGSIGSNFTCSIFKNLDSLKSSWNDGFTLTEHAQNSFASIPSVSSECLRASLSALGPKYQDIEKCRKKVKALAVIKLEYKLSWPIQIVITPATILSYQRIFTFLLQIRRGAYILSRQTIKADHLNSTLSSEERELYYSVRMRFLWFTNTIYYYLTSLVLEPCSQKMQTDMKAAEDVDMMIKVHSNYMKSCIDQTLLGNDLGLIHKTVLKVLDLAIMLEDSQVIASALNKSAIEEQQSLMDLSIAGLGLEVDQRYGGSIKYPSRPTQNIERQDLSSDDDSDSDDIDFSFVSSQLDNTQIEDLAYTLQLQRMKSEFQRLMKFIVHGLKGVARVAGNENARLWDTLGDMLEIGFDS